MAENEKEVVEVVDNTNSNNNNNNGNVKDSDSDSNNIVQENVTNDENKDKDIVDDDDDSLVEFDDSDDDTADDDSDDDDEDDDKSDKKPPKKISREEARKNAKLRRMRKEKELNDSYYKGIKVATGEVNPYTNEKMTSDEDVQVYLDMKEMESKGLDPLSSTDYIKFQNEKRKDELEQIAFNKKVQEKQEKDMKEFKSKYPDVDIEKLVESDELVGSLIISQVSQGKSLTKAYETVKKLVDERVNEAVKKEADNLAKKKLQNSVASPGSMVNGEDNNNNNGKDWRKGSSEEFAKGWNKLIDELT